MPTKRLRYFNFGPFQNADELKGVDDGFTLIVIVGDDESHTRALGDFVDPCCPGSKLFG